MKQKQKVLIIVAHPDDETIWMGGTILKNIKKWNLTIICLCRKNDKDRYPRFRKACRIYNAKCFISDLDDEKLNRINAKEAAKRIKKYAGKHYDYIFTHGKNGEYGHIRHKDVYKAVNELLRNKKLFCKEAFFFSYIKKNGICCAKKGSDKFISLSNSLLHKKRGLIKTVYGFKGNSFEYNCSRKAESFARR